MDILTLPLGPLETNCYVVFEDGLCALIDPGAQPQKITDTLAERSLHESFPDVPIYVSAQDTDEMTNMSHGNLVYTETFLDGDEISVGPMVFHVLATPGHTLGSSCFVCGDVLFSGDTLFAGCCGRTDLPGGNQAQMMASLKRLGSLPGDYRVLPGHGEESTLEQERRTNYYMRGAMRV